MILEFSKPDGTIGHLDTMTSEHFCDEVDCCTGSYISRATKTSGEWETLYKATGTEITWVIHRWKREFANGIRTIRTIFSKTADEEYAAEWLGTNGYLYERSGS